MIKMPVCLWNRVRLIKAFSYYLYYYGDVWNKDKYKKRFDIMVELEEFLIKNRDIKSVSKLPKKYRSAITNRLYKLPFNFDIGDMVKHTAPLKEIN